MADREDNRVVYIEPTEIKGTDKMGYVSPLEDYTLFADLKIIKGDRFGCGKETSSVREYSSSNGTISFLDGTNGNLTTNFTDISYTSPDNNTNECLGIKSISIEYTSWYVPMITIVFVDVRGASLMAKNEAYYNGSATQQTFFNDLFSFPYPLFELTIKGYYGSSTKYTLSLMSTDASFDAASGNFEVRANFLGNLFGIFRDIPSEFIAIAPYVSYNGGNYWDKRNYTFSEGGHVTPIPKINDLRLRIAQLSGTEEYKQFVREKDEKISGLDVKRKFLKHLIENYPCKDFTEPEGEDFLYLTMVDGNYDGLKHIDKLDANGEKYIYTTKYIDDFNNYKQNYNPSSKLSMDFLLKYVTLTKKAGKTGWDCEIRKLNNGGYASATGEELKNTKEKLLSIPEIAKLTQTYGGSAKRVTIVYYEKADKTFINNLAELSEEITAFEQQINDIESEFEQVNNIELSKALGFKPSIRNFYEIIFAHTDTFINLFYSLLKKIDGKLIGVENRNERILSEYGLSLANSDLPKITQDGLMPPFVALYRFIESEGQKKRELFWPGEITNGENLDEVKFIEAFLEGTKMYNEDLRTLEEALSNEKYNINGDIRKYIPLTLYDILHFRDGFSNPYYDGIDMDKSDISNDIITLFVNRLYYFVRNSGYTFKSDKGRSFGILDAINLYKAVGKTTNTAFNNFYTEYISTPQEGTKKILSMIQKSGGDWNITQRPMIYNSGQGANYNWIEDREGNRFLPIGNNRTVDIKNDISNNDFKNGRYLNLTDTYSGSTDTCKIFNERNFLSDIISNLSEGNFGEFEEFEVFRGDFAKNMFSSIMDNDFTEKAYNLSIFAKLTEEDKAKGGKRTNDYYSNEHYSVDKLITGKELKEAFKNEKYDNIYLKNATQINEDSKRELFGHPIYWLQKNMKAKAYLFTMAVPLLHNNKTNGIDCENGAELKMKLLREGAEYWREDGGDKSIVTQGHITGNIFGFNINDDFAYQRPNSSQSYLAKNSFLKYDTLNPLLLSDRKQYMSFKKPDGLTINRRETVKKYFEEWAEKEYPELDLLLMDSDCYTMEKVSQNKNGEIENLTINYRKGYYGDNGNSDALNKCSRLQTLLKNLYFDVDFIIDCAYPSDYTKSGHLPVNTVQYSALDGGINSFLTQLKKLYEGYVTGEDSADVENGNQFNEIDIKLSLYATLKNLYERWCCSTPKSKYSLDGVDSIFNKFIYTDVFFHDIGDRLMIDLTSINNTIAQCIPSSDMRVGTSGTLSINNFLTNIAEGCGANLLPLPIFYGTLNKESFEEMFSANPHIKGEGEDTSSYVVLYRYRQSNHLNTGIDYRNDGFLLDGTDIVPSLADEGKYMIPAFAVSYAKQNQSLFKSVTLSTTQPPITDHTLQAEQDIASRASESPRETALKGQNIYNIYSQQGFECEVEMMGNAQVLPCMYFQLNNIPLWNGAYYITSVKHDIEAGNMTTSFKGIRMSKNSIPLAEMDDITFNYTSVNVDVPNISNKRVGSQAYYDIEPGRVPTTTNEGADRLEECLQMVTEKHPKTKNKYNFDTAHYCAGITSRTLRVYNGLDLKTALNTGGGNADQVGDFGAGPIIDADGKNIATTYKDTLVNNLGYTVSWYEWIPSSLFPGNTKGNSDLVLNKMSDSNVRIDVGDVVVYYGVSGNKVKKRHTALYKGIPSDNVLQDASEATRKEVKKRVWASDFRQNEMFVYGASAKSVDKWLCVLFKHA